MTEDRSTRLSSVVGLRSLVLNVLHGARVRPLPVFSGLPSLTASGLRAAGVRYSEAHTDALKMARAAASTHELFGFASAVVPFDLCVEAEALGGVVDFQSDVDAFIAPVVVQPLSADGLLHIANRVSRLSGEIGRVPLVSEAIRQLKASIGDEIVIGACVPGPFTLAWQLFGAEAWLGHVGTHGCAPLLKSLADFLARVAVRYRTAGADFITVHEMGGSPQVLGAATFRARVRPALAHLFEQLPAPNVLSICGDTNAVMADMAACGASALSVDQRNDLARSRRVLGDEVILFGNLDPVNVLAQGTPDLIGRTVRANVTAGANAIWPGCDLVIETPDENMRAFADGGRRTVDG